MSRTYGKAQDLIDFTRASSGTALRRVKYGAELVTNGTFDSDVNGWYGVSAGVVSHDSTNNALKVTANAGDNFAAGETTISTVAGAVYKLVVDIISFSGINVQIGIATTSNGVDISLSNQTDLQYSVIFVAQSSTTYIKFGTNDTSGLSHNAVFDNISVKEVTFDTSDGDLILFNHPNNIPRIEYDANGNLLGLLVEESRTNLIPYSDLSSNWTEFNATKTISSIEAPNGDLMYELNSTATGVPTGTVTTYSSTSGTYTVSAILKAGTTNYAFVGISDNATGQAEIRFNLSSGTYDTTNVGFVGSWTNVSGSIVDLGNGFYRCSTTGTQGAGNPVSSRIIAGAPDGSRSQTVINTKLYATGAQLESGSFMTSLIPTSGSTATRSADIASLSTSAFGYRQDEGSVVVDVRAINDSGYPFIFSLDDGSSDNRVFSVFSNSNTNIYARITSGGVTQGSLYRGIDGDAGFKLAVTYSPDEMVVSEDGETVTQTSISSLPAGISALNIASSHFSTGQITGHIKSLKYYPRALTADQIEALTA